MRRGRWADTYENGRDRPAGRNGIGGIAKMAAKEVDDLVPESCQGLLRITVEFLIRKKLYQCWSQGEFSEHPNRTDGFAHDEIGGIMAKRGQQGIEIIRQFAKQARDF